MSSALRLPPRRLTVPEFLEWADATPGRWQLRDGEPELMAPPVDAHGSTQAELVVLISNHLRSVGSRCRVVVGPGVVPRVRSDRNMLVPDLAVTCAPPSRERALPEPLVLFEVLSPSNEADTWANVWAYTTIPSVAEIVVVGSVAVGAEVLRRRPDGSWPEGPEAVGPADALRVGAIGFEVPLRDLYRTSPLADG